MKRCTIVLDLGTSSIKCGCVDPAGRLVEATGAGFHTHSDGARCETDFEECGSVARSVLRDTVKAALEAGRRVEAVLVTGQAQTFAPVDADFRPLGPGIVWLDARAEDEAAALAEMLPDFDRTAGFREPLPALYVAKLLWLKSHRPDVFGNAAHFPLISDYVAHQLTGRFYSDSCTFGMGGVYDITAKTLNGRALRALGLGPDVFPEIADPVELGYTLTPAAQRELHIDDPVPVYLCGNDQSASAVGSGLTNVGDVSVNFGTAMAAYTLADALPDELGPQEIAGISPAGARYFLLSYEPDMGRALDALKARHFPESPYDELFESRSSVPEVAAFVQHCLDRFRGHLSRVGRLGTPERVYVSGGMTRSEAWLDLLRRHCDHEILCSNRQEAGLIGAARICAMKRGGDDA